jgi:hypothetical protein
MSLMVRLLKLSVLLLAVAGLSADALAQNKEPAINPQSSCSRDNALNIIQRQIDLGRTIDSDAKRISLTLRAADLMWPAEQDKARATFSDAFDVAARLFKEKGAPDSSDGRLRVQGTDYRYTVITAIGKRDSAWARKLSKQILDEEAEAAKAEAEAAKEKSESNAQAARTSEQLMNVALGLLATDQQSAIQFARSSFSYPATMYLPFFFFKLSEANRSLADQFYVEALNSYSRVSMDQFLYLSFYPFAANREIGEMPMWTIYQAPSGLAPNPALQRLFVSTLLGRARDLIQNPVTPKVGTRWTENSQVFMALSRVEPLIANSWPDLAAQVAEARGSIAALLTQPEQQRTTDVMKDPPKQTFDEIIEAADKLANADTREARISLAIMNAAETGTESIEKLEAAGMKIEDIKLRQQVMSLAYFNRSQKLLKDKKIDEARRLAAKVEEADQRAYLYAKIADESLKQKKDDAEVREMLEDVIETVAKSPDSEVKARAMLVVVHLYSTIDANRAVSLLGDVIKTINHVESIGLTGDRINLKIEGKAFGSYRGLQTPGFSPEVVFREMGKLDFDGTLYLASNLNDKSVRGMTTLAIADQCLKDLPPPPKPQKPPAAKPQ